MTTKKLNARIKELRQLLKKTQVEFAEELQTTQANISYIENGSCMPTGDFIDRLASRYPEINFNWLVRGEGAPRLTDERVQAAKEAEKRVEKRYIKDFAELNDRIARLEKDNSTLIGMLPKKK